MTLKAVLEPPVGDDPYWVISAPAIRYAAQGRTRAEAARNFEEGLDQAIEWADAEGQVRAYQPEVLEYEW